MTHGVELPVQPTNQPWTRTADDVRSMAVAIQANLVQLRVADVRRRAGEPGDLGTVVVSPGAVHVYRETLLDRTQLKQYTALDLQLRVREVWGQYSLMRWVFNRNVEDEATDFSRLPSEAELRCDSVLDVKLAELEGLFWRLRFEQRRRHDTEYVASDRFEEDARLAETIPATAFSTPVPDATDEALLHASCEFAGMLATLRWIMDRRRTWGEPGIMEVGDRPF